MEVATTLNTAFLLKALTRNREAEAGPSSTSSAATCCSASLGFVRSLNSVETWIRPATVPKSTQTCPISCNGDSKDRLEDDFESVVPSVTFAFEECLEKHLNPELSQKKGRYQCQFCDYSSDKPSNIRRHENKHTGEKPHVCQLCLKGFTQKGNLDIHLRTVHEREKSFECPTCGRIFKRQTNLQKHEKVHESEEPEGPFVCRDCGKSFAKKTYLSKHHRVHTGGKRYECIYCGKSFTVHGNLKRHVVNIHIKGSTPL